MYMLVYVYIQKRACVSVCVCACVCVSCSTRVSSTTLLVHRCFLDIHTNIVHAPILDLPQLVCVCACGQFFGVFLERFFSRTPLELIVCVLSWSCVTTIQQCCRWWIVFISVVPFGGKWWTCTNGTSISNNWPNSRGRFAHILEKNPPTVHCRSNLWKSLVTGHLYNMTFSRYSQFYVHCGYCAQHLLIDGNWIILQ